jgi:hypothetical protein
VICTGCRMALLWGGKNCMQADLGRHKRSAIALQQAARRGPSSQSAAAAGIGLFRVEFGINGCGYHCGICSLCCGRFYAWPPVLLWHVFANGLPCSPFLCMAAMFTAQLQHLRGTLCELVTRQCMNLFESELAGGLLQRAMPA